MIYHDLLPEEYAARVRHEKLSRFYILLFSYMSAFGVIVLVLLLPSYFSLSYEQGGIGGEIDAAKQSVGSKRVTEAESSLKILNQQISGIVDYHQARAGIYVARIANATPPGVALTRLAYNEASASIDIEGVADLRDNLLTFIAALKNDSAFSSLDSPITNLLKETKVAFHMSVTIATAKPAPANPPPAKTQTPEAL